MNSDGNISFNNQLTDKDTVIKKINAGEFLILAGDEKTLEGLPTGNWIAGTIPYFMSEDGGCVAQDKIYVTSLQGISSQKLPRITLYDQLSIERIAQEAPEQGFTIVILPANSDVHLRYAQNAPEFANMFFSPIIGWISGVHLDELSSHSAKVGFGPAAGMLTDNQAVAMHVAIGEQQLANINIVNLFKPTSGQTIRFPNKGFSVSDCTVNGETWKFSDYVREYKIDTRLPLVADYSGVMVNVSIQEVLDDKVNLYAPVFSDIDYHFADPVGDYINQFDQAISQQNSTSNSFCCNCILNFLYSELDGKKTGQLTGPMTFGEVAYQLLNQTLAYLSIENV